MATPPDGFRKVQPSRILETQTALRRNASLGFLGGFRAHPALSILYPGHYAFRNLAFVAQAPLGRMTALRCFHHDTRSPY